jgi:1-aminocyclopropane-1-carboxylate deaminase
MPLIQKDLATVTPLSLPTLHARGITGSILRLDKVHPVISGNKWFKLQFYLEKAIAENKKRIVTFGGPWSNHLVATAAACKELGIASKGIVRGEAGDNLSATLADARSFGMELSFISRTSYAAQKKLVVSTHAEELIIPEGGYGPLGAQGAATIVSLLPEQSYTHMLCAVGTGTLLAGLTQAMPTNCHCIGIPVLKGKEALEQAIHQLVMTATTSWELIEGFEWGGYAKHTPSLLQFMNDFFNQTAIPTDLVYTSKLCYAFFQLVQQDYFQPGSHVLLIHSGGLQGNRSLPQGLLTFSS